MEILCLNHNLDLGIVGLTLWALWAFGKQRLRGEKIEFESVLAGKVQRVGLED